MGLFQRRVREEPKEQISSDLAVRVNEILRITDEFRDKGFTNSHYTTYVDPHSAYLGSSYYRRRDGEIPMDLTVGLFHLPFREQRIDEHTVKRYGTYIMTLEGEGVNERIGPLGSLDIIDQFRIIMDSYKPQPEPAPE
ncbi:hypothetical protein HY637_05315 [Candidatus Woesearchaeota archaeon]|nr:hypothetical protein [Candidatus Woesearchaeota archaeon]